MTFAALGAVARRALGPYPGLFDVPGPTGFVIAGFVSRLTASMVTVGLVLAITARGDSYATAGTVLAVLPLAFGLMSPFFGRRIDRYGQREVLVPLTIAFGVVMTALAVAIGAGAPTWVLCPLAAGAGVVLPSAAPLVRARWTKLYQGTPKLRAAYGFDSANTEVVFIVGPILVTALATGVGPEAGLAAVVVCAVAGTLALAAQRSTQPDPAGPAARRTASALRFPALRAIYLTRLCLGGVLGAVPVVTVAYATAQHGRGFSGLLLGAWGTASMAGGLIYGAAGVATPLARRLLASVLMFAAGFIPLLFVSGIVSLALLLLVAGLAMAPIAVSVMEVMQQVVPASMLTETLSWDGTALAFGLSAGALTGGEAVSYLGVSHVYAVPAGYGLLALLAVLAGGRHIRAACEPAVPPAAAPRTADRPGPAS
jgi:MFS family permease